SSRRRHTRSYGDWSSDVCSSDLGTCFLIDGISYLAVVAALFAMRVKRVEGSEKAGGALGEFLGGAKYAFGFQPIRAILLLAAGEIGRASCRERVEVWVGAAVWRR